MGLFQDELTDTLRLPKYLVDIAVERMYVSAPSHRCVCATHLQYDNIEMRIKLAVVVS